MTKKQKAVHDELKKLEESNRTLAWYESAIRSIEERMERADKDSRKKYRKQIADMKKEKERFEADVQRARDMIESCSDTRGKQILHSRYIDLIRMEDIAYIMGYERTNLYRVYYRALNNIQQMKQ